MIERRRMMTEICNVVQKIRVEDSTGEFIEILPVGTRVYFKGHPKLTGTIVAWEYHESGKVSPLPYLVHWDDYALSRKYLGWFDIYPMKSEILPVAVDIEVREG